MDLSGLFGLFFKLFGIYIEFIISQHFWLRLEKEKKEKKQPYVASAGQAEEKDICVNLISWLFQFVGTSGTSLNK